MSDFNAQRINSAIRTLNALNAVPLLSDAEQDYAARRMPVTPPKTAGLTPEQNIIIELCQHIEAIADFLHTSKIAYRKDAAEICKTLARAQDCHNRALGLGVHKGRGIVK